MLVAFKRLLRPFVSLPQNDLWERQRVFNLILLDALERRGQEQARKARKLDDIDHRTLHLEEFLRQGLSEVMRHDDALFGRVDRKLDRYRRETAELAGLLRAALARRGADGKEQRAPGSEELRVLHAEASYLAFENRFRGTSDDIRERLRDYLPRLRKAAPVLDLGCGRGEALELLQAEGIECRGVDASSTMVSHCREKGLPAERRDVLDALSGADPESFGGIVSFHVIEHLEPGCIERLVQLAFAVLRPGGILVLETPNPLSVAVTARSFWLDPTHRRPVHPDTLRTWYEQAGFTGIERLDLRPYPEEERLPEIPLDGLDGQSRELADRLNRLRDDLDDLLFGYRDYALIGRRPHRGDRRRQACAAERKAA